MTPWHLWTAALGGALHQLAAWFGGSEGLAIVALTLAARVLLAPVSLTAALRQDAQRRKLSALKPRLEELKSRHAADPRALSQATMALYREEGISFLDRLTLANVGTQAALGLGLWQALRASAFSGRFLWIPSLARPDIALTLAVGALMALAMAVAPGHAEATAQAGQWALLLSVGLAVFTLWAMPSAMGVYWAASNVATLAQSAALRAAAARRAQTPTGAVDRRR